MDLAQPVPVLVVGAGIMGAGIAQVAAQAGHRVLIHDAREGAAEAARRKLESTFDALVAKGRMAADDARAAAARLGVAATLEAAREAGLVVEAIVEQLEAKRSLLRQLEALAPEDCILASNTSSISITALANGLKAPGRVVGMHFFNPVPLMKLVEVVSGLQTDAQVAAQVCELARRWGKVPVHARSTPGFIVNRIARPYYAEALALLQERAAEPPAIDACLRGAGFRMGPCELMDLIGHDTNFAVTQSVYEANFGDKRFMPSLVQRELVDGGLLGRKTGRGFYLYDAQGRAQGMAAVVQPGAVAVPDVAHREVVLHGHGPLVDRWRALLAQAGQACREAPSSLWSGLQVGSAQLRLTDGRAAGQVAAQEGVRDVALFDLVPGAAPPDATPALAWSAADAASPAWQAEAAQWLAAAGTVPQRVADAPGLVVARTIAMLVNEAADAVQQGVCTEAAADEAMRLGVNYPAGPFEWLAAWGAAPVASLLDHLDHHYRGERYRVSPALRRRGWERAQPRAGLDET